MRTTNTEDFVYRAVISGELEIDARGRIWRVANRRGGRNRKTTIVVPCKRKRAEHPLPSGYLQVRVMFDGKRHNALAHRLVYRHFKGKIPQGLLVNHKNYNRSDNRPKNLELHTETESLIDRPTFNQLGQRNHHCKLSDAQVADIKTRRLGGQTLLSIAKAFGVSFQHVSKICRQQRRS